MNVDVDSFVKQWKKETAPFREEHDLDVNFVNSRFVFATDRANPQAGILYTNNHGMEALRWLITQIVDPKGPEFSNKGITTNRFGLEIIHETLIATIPNFDAAGFDKRAIANVERVISTLGDTLSHKNQIVSLSLINGDLPKSARDLTTAHEVFHGWQFKVEADSGEAPVLDEWASQQRGYGKFLAWLRAHHAPSDGSLVDKEANVAGKRSRLSAKDVGRELIAYAITGHLQPAGFSRQDTSNIVSSYLLEVVQTHGVKPLGLIGSVSQDARDIITRLEAKYEIAEQRRKQLEKGLRHDQDKGKTERTDKGPRFQEIRIDGSDRGSGPGAGIEGYQRARIGEAIAGTAESESGGGLPEQRGLRSASTGIAHLSIEVEGKSSQPATTTIRQEALDIHAALPDPNSPHDSDPPNDDRRNAVNARLIKSLREIATIEATDPDGARYTWRDIAAISARIAREALPTHEIRERSPEVSHRDRPHWVSESGGDRARAALREIAGIESLDPTKHSWKDRAGMAINIAREALGAIQREETARNEENRVERRNRGPGHALGL